MADSATSNFGWIKPEIGGSNNTWGNKLNDNFEEIDNEVFRRLDRDGDVMGGKLVLHISDATEASMNLPAGIAPDAPVDGDIWATGVDIFFRFGGVTGNILTTFGPSVDVPWNNHRLQLLGVGTIVTDAVNLGQVQKSLYNWTIADAAGSGDAIVANYSPPFTAWVDGMIMFVRARAANTIAAPTILANALTAKVIAKLDGDPLIPGDIAGVGHELFLRYSAVLDKVILINPAGVDAASLAGNNTFTGNNTYSGDAHFTGTFTVDQTAILTAGYNAGRAIINKDTIFPPVAIVVPASGNIVWDLSLGTTFTILMPAADKTLAPPINVTPGQRGTLIVTNDSAAIRSLTWDPAFKFAAYSEAAIDKSIGGVAVYEYTALAANNIIMEKVWGTSGVGGGYEDFDCGLFSAVASTIVTKPNNTKGMPSRVEALLRVETADSGYAVGEWLNSGLMVRDTGGGGNSGGVQVSCNLANIYAVCGSNLYTLDKTSKTMNPVDSMANYRLFLRVWR